MNNGVSYKRILTEEEFGHLFTECHLPFVRVANSYVHDTPVAEDLVNDSFVRLWEKRDEILTNNFEAYLFQIVIRRCLDYLKTQKTQIQIREKMHESGYRLLLHEINSLESCNPEQLYTRDMERLILETIERMPALTREIFLAHRDQNQTYQEIADRFGVSVRRVTHEIQRALQELRFSLKDYLPSLSLLLFLEEIQN